MVNKFYYSKILLVTIVILGTYSNQIHAQADAIDAPVMKYKERGFENITGVSFLFSEGKSALSIHTINGYRPNPFFSIGIGIGLEFYKDTYLAPIFIDPRVNFIKGPFSPFIYFDVGYAFGKTDSIDRLIQMGPIFNPGIGFKANIQAEFAFCISLGYKYQIAKFHKDLYLLDGTFTEHYNNDYHLLVVNFELTF